MRLRDAALAISDPNGPLPITHVEGRPVADAIRRGPRMVSLARDLARQRRNASVIRTASVHANCETSKRGTESIVLPVQPGDFRGFERD